MGVEKGEKNFMKKCYFTIMLTVSVVTCGLETKGLRVRASPASLRCGP